MDNMLEVGKEVASKIAGKYAAKMHSVSYDEFNAEALYILQLATGSYNPEGGRSWASYVYERIHYGIIDFLRDGATMGSKRGRSNIIIHFQEKANEVLEAMIAEDTDPLDKAICSERLAHIHTLLDDLGAGCKEIFLAYVEGMPVAQIVEKFGYNPATITKAVTRIQMYIETRGSSARYELPYRPKPFTKALSDEVRLLWQGGATFVDLAEQYNTTPTNIRTICLRLRKMDKE